jgi:hypothetical protein
MDFIKPKTVIIIFISFVTLVILYTSISHANYLKKDYKLRINFLVSKRIDKSHGLCDLYDAEGKKIPIKSRFFGINEIYTGDSIVKKENSNLLYVYRKKNWNDEFYYIAEKLYLE